MLYNLKCYYNQEEEVETLNELSADEIVEKYLSGFGNPIPIRSDDTDSDIDTENEDIANNPMMSFTSDGKYIVQKYEGTFIDIWQRATKRVSFYVDVPCTVYRREYYSIETDIETTDDEIIGMLGKMENEMNVDEAAEFEGDELLIDTIQEEDTAEIIFNGETIKSISNE